MTSQESKELETTELDSGRLTRALLLHSDRAGEGQYRIVGGREAHWVDLYTADHPKCDCGDHVWRGTVCKHILAALLREGNERVIHAVGSLVTALKGVAA